LLRLKDPEAAQVEFKEAARLEPKLIPPK